MVTEYVDMRPLAVPMVDALGIERAELEPWDDMLPAGKAQREAWTRQHVALVRNQPRTLVVRPWSIKLSAENVQDIRALYDTGEWTQAQIGEMYDVHHTTVSKILNGDLWQHVA